MPTQPLAQPITLQQVSPHVGSTAQLYQLEPVPQSGTATEVVGMVGTVMAMDAQQQTLGLIMQSPVHQFSRQPLLSTPGLQLVPGYEQQIDPLHAERMRHARFVIYLAFGALLLSTCDQPVLLC